MKQRMGIWMAVALVALMMVGCPVVHVRDELTIRNIGDDRLVYQEDVARAAGLDDPALLTEEAFPVGGLTWEEYQAALAQFDAHLDYEQAKQEPGDE